MDLTIEGGTSAIFLASMLSSFIWHNRNELMSKTKTSVSNFAKYFVSKYKKVLRRGNKHKLSNKDKSSNQSKAEESNTLQSIANEENKPAQKSDELSAIQKKDNKPKRKKRNMRRSTRNYEQCILRRAIAKLLDAEETSEFREHLRQIEERKWSIDLGKAKPKNIYNIQEIEKFVEQQLDIQEQEVAFVLPYDPFYNSEEENNKDEPKEPKQ